MKENIVEEIDLENGQKLEIHDISRVIAEDTCLVGIIFKIKIDIDENLFKKNKETTDYLIVREKLGERIKYEVKHERNFISIDQRNDVFNEVKESFLNTNLKYLSHPEFAEKYVLKKFSN